MVYGDLARSRDHIAIGGQLLQPDRSPRVEAAGRDADFRPKAEFKTIAELGRGVPQRNGAVDAGDEDRLPTAASPVTMASVCPLPWRRIWATASATPSTTLTDRHASSHSVSKSPGSAGVEMRHDGARAGIGPEPAAERREIGDQHAAAASVAIAASISRVSVAPQIAGAAHLGVGDHRPRHAGSAAAWT